MKDTVTSYYAWQRPRADAPPTGPRRSSESPGLISSATDAITTNVDSVLRGKREVIRLAWTCLLADGHLLIEDVPGTGKTSLAKALAASIDGSINRVQFTPDLLPGDITGVSIYDQRTQQFEFRHGPIFANIVVADEINRASPKTQSALLEVMEESRVTVDGVAHAVPQPFLVIATQNPIDLEGTYRLPEAQLDRFLMRISVGHANVEATQEVLSSRSRAVPTALRPVLSLDQMRWLRQAVAEVHVADEITRYIALLAEASRDSGELRLGVSMRGCLGLLRASQAYAACLARDYVVPADVKAVACAVLAHRLVLTAQAEVRGIMAKEVLARLLAVVPVPTPVGCDR